MSSAIYVQMSPEDQDRLDAEALAWSRANPVLNLYRNRMVRFSAFAIFTMRGRDGFCIRDYEVGIHLAADDHADAVKRLRSAALAIEPRIDSDPESFEVEIYNIESEDKRPDTVLRGVVASSRDNQGIDPDPIWLFTPWPGYREQFNRPRFER